jgi:hypothetical protein
VISARDATAALGPLASLPYWGQMEHTGKQALRDALMESARDVAQAKQIIADWLRDARELPTPADIRSLAIATAPAARPAARHNCLLCGGTGHRPYWHCITEHYGPAGRPYTTKRDVRSSSILEHLQQRRVLLDAGGRVCEFAERCVCAISMRQGVAA